jgi:hypothetical protein
MMREVHVEGGKVGTMIGMKVADRNGVHIPWIAPPLKRADRTRTEVEENPPRTTRTVL